MNPEQIAWDDTVLPFQLDRSDIRGRVVRLDGVLEQVLHQHSQCWLQLQVNQHQRLARHQLRGIWVLFKLHLRHRSQHQLSHPPPRVVQSV